MQQRMGYHFSLIIPLNPLIESITPTVVNTLKQHNVEIANLMEMVLFVLAHDKFWPNTRYSELSETGQIILQFEDYAENHLTIIDSAHPSLELSKTPLLTAMVALMIKGYFLMESFLSKFNIDLHDPKHHIELVRSIPGNSLLISVKHYGYPL